MLQCEACSVWVHIACLGLSQAGYESRDDPLAEKFELYCPECVLGK